MIRINLVRMGRVLVAGLVFAGFAAVVLAEEGAARKEKEEVEIPVGREGAWIAQKLYREERYQEAGEMYLQAALGSDPITANRYRYNAALAFFRAGSYAEAAEAVRSQMKLADQEAAAELYGAASLALAQAAATNIVALSRGLEEAADGLQQAARAAPEDGRRQRNLDRALKHLPEAREEAHIAEVLEKYGQVPPDALLQRMMHEQRRLIEDAQTAFTNRQAQATIDTLEELARRQDTNTDLWIPLKRQLVESGAITNEEQRAEVAMRIESTRAAMKKARRQLADIDTQALGSAQQGEAAAYGFWQMLAMPPGLVDEAIAAQTNAWAHPDKPLVYGREDQPEAARLTEMFQDRFPEWADQVQQQSQADTNAPSLSPEDRSEIERLAEETVRLHAEIASKPEGIGEAGELQLRALKNLERIRELLPKSEQSRQSPESQPPPESQPEQQEQDSQPQEEKQEEEEQEQEQEQKEREETPPEAQEVLRRALEREKEHEEDKKRQMRQMPLPPGARDW